MTQASRGALVIVPVHIVRHREWRSFLEQLSRTHQLFSRKQQDDLDHFLALTCV